jgi:hypothetical protein
MIAQVLFTLALLTVVLIAFAQLSQLPLIGGASICVALFGIYLVWMPEDATHIAHFVGVGRGADLIMYVWILISFSVWLLIYLSVRDQLQLITSLARNIALKEPLGGSNGDIATQSAVTFARDEADARSASSPAKQTSQITLAK